MKTKTLRIVLITLTVIILVIVSISRRQEGFQTQVGEFQTQSGTFPFKTEIVSTPEDTARGFMHRPTIEPNQAMMFVLPEEKPQQFWMKNVEFPLDIVYLNANQKVASIVHDAAPHTEISRPSIVPAKYAVEIPGGTAASIGLSKGDVWHVKN
jgi:uncharacterized membrane protein (UPF0127 family)